MHTIEKFLIKIENIIYINNAEIAKIFVLSNMCTYFHYIEHKNVGKIHQ